MGERMVEGVGWGSADCQKGGVGSANLGGFERKSPAVHGRSSRRGGAGVGLGAFGRDVPCARGALRRPDPAEDVVPVGKAEMPASALVCRGKAKRGTKLGSITRQGVSKRTEGARRDSGGDTRDPGPRAHGPVARM